MSGLTATPGRDAGGSVGVTARVTGPSHSSVTASLDDMRTLAEALRKIQQDLDGCAKRTLSIEWNLPARGDILSPGTAWDCTEDATVAAARIGAVAWSARLFASMIDASVSAYEAAEEFAKASILQATAVPRLLVVVAGAMIAASPQTKQGAKFDLPDILSFGVSGVDGLLPGDYESNMQTLSHLAAAISTPSPIIRTTLAQGPGTAHPAPAARSIGDSMGAISRLYEGDEETAHIQVQRVIDPTTGLGSWVAIVPGTSKWSLDGKNPLDLSGNLRAAGGMNSGGEQAVKDALTDAMAREGVSDKHEPVMLVGHSQGGMVMTNLARHDTGLNIQRVVTLGSPVLGSAVPRGVQALNIEHRQDIVGRLAGQVNGADDPRRTRIVMNDPSVDLKPDGTYDPIQAHDPANYRRNYEEVMKTERRRRGSSAAAFERGSSGFFTGTARTYVYDARRIDDGVPSLMERARDATALRLRTQTLR